MVIGISLMPYNKNYWGMLIMLNKKQALGLRIREFREKQKLTQEKLAELVGIDSKHLSRIENGRNYPSIETLEKLTDNLHITFEDVFQLDHIRNREFLLLDLNGKLETLPDEKLNFIYKMVKEL